MIPDVIIREDDQFITPKHTGLVYTGRIDFTNPSAPCFVYAGSQIHFRFRGTELKIIIRNHHLCYDNFIGLVIDRTNQSKIKLAATSEVTVFTLAERLEDTEHDVVIFKRQDAAHYFDFLGLILNKASLILEAPAKPNRRMECFGDSVTAGEVSEAVDCVGKSDPVHNGEYSNSWYSYAALTARKLGAQLHNNGQGGLALLDHTGYFHSPDYIGLQSTYDKLRYNTQISPYTPWDFKLYTPHVVIIAIGQNDAHPENYMGKDQRKSENWKECYQSQILKFRDLYPNALIILTTTILNHSEEWDDAIHEVTKRINDPKITHFLYTNNGCGTPGHIRIPEAEQMAEELSALIEAYGNDIWN